MNKLKSKYDQVIEKLQKSGKVEVIEEKQKDKIVSQVEKDLDEYRFENQKRIRESQEAIAQIVLTA